uniref:Uncharacterized protein n=1 Tax=Arundo donax TaxID=35708 RepID=A0A0A9FEA7_ARUDO
MEILGSNSQYLARFGFRAAKHSVPVVCDIVICEVPQEQRDKFEEDGELREGQVEVLYYPQHCFRFDVGPVLLDKNNAGDVVGSSP